MKEKFIQLSSMATICFVLVTSQAIAGEGGTSHITPGATATLSDFPGTAPAQFVKFMYVDYSGEFSAQLPTAAGITSNIQADSNTIALVAGKTFEKTVLGGAHYSMAIAVPYTSLEVSGRVSLPGGGSVARSNSAEPPSRSAL